MILKGNQRAGGIQLAHHLMNVEDNEHVTVHEMRGFISDDLYGAFNEAYAISRGTKCQQFLFSLSLNPPENEIVPIEVFEKAITDIEEKIGLTNQPRALVFHEKEGRRHAHCVWSRIDAEQMKAINLPHYKLKLRDISRELYLEHGWNMPRGLMNSEERNPLNFTQAEWQQAKRIKQDPRAIKQALQDCWAISDSKLSFANALEERGYYLAKGDRRGFVAVDWQGEVYAISRAIGIRTKNVTAKLGNPDNLLSVDETHKRLAEKFTDKLRQFADDEITKHDKATAVLNKKRRTLMQQHRHARHTLHATHAQRWANETKIRSERLPRGLKALWFRVTGKYKQIKLQNEAEAETCKHRDRQELQALIQRHLDERRHLQHEIRQLRHHHSITIKKLNRDVAEYLKLSPKTLNRELQKPSQDELFRKRKRSRTLSS